MVVRLKTPESGFSCSRQEVVQNKMASSRSAWRGAPIEAVIDYVQIDGLVVLKIIKHCQDEGAGTTDVAQGVLLGLVVENRLEITNCFPYPRHADDDEFDVDYQMEMMRHLRQVNIDHLCVGWYQSTYYGGFLNKALLESQFSYQNSIEESVVLVYDPLKTARGFLSLRAFRLTKSAMQLFKDGDFTPESFKNLKLGFETMFEEIKIVVRNSHLTGALLCEMTEMMPEDQGNQFLDLSTANVLEKNVRSLMESVDELTQEANKFVNYQRQVTKQQQAKQQHIQKRAQENASRQQKNEPPLPEEDANKLFKPITPPARLDGSLYAGQVNNYCQQISQFATQSLSKLFVAETLQIGKNKPAA